MQIIVQDPPVNLFDAVMAYRAAQAKLAAAKRLMEAR